jgi:hypothetical protein
MEIAEPKGAPLMFKNVQKFVVYGWNFVFNHNVSPLRNIPDIAIRHYVLQALGLMWALSFAVATGSYIFMAASVIGHTVLIGAAAITVATWTAAAAKPELFLYGSARKNDAGVEDPNDN